VQQSALRPITPQRGSSCLARANDTASLDCKPCQCPWKAHPCCTPSRSARLMRRSGCMHCRRSAAHAPAAGARGRTVTGSSLQPRMAAAMSPARCGQSASPARRPAARPPARLCRSPAQPAPRPACRRSCAASSAAGPPSGPRPPCAAAAACSECLAASACSGGAAAAQMRGQGPGPGVQGRAGSRHRQGSVVGHNMGVGVSARRLAPRLEQTTLCCALT